MPSISVYSENQFYTLGIKSLIKELLDEHDNTLGDQVEANKHQKKRIFFYEDLAVINSFENEFEYPPFLLFVIFNTKGLFLSEIKMSILSVLNISQRSRRANTHLNKIKEILPSESEQLTFHEMKIIKLLAKGNSISTIAKIMNCKNSTIYTHRRNILRKTRTANRQQLNKIIQVLKNYDTKYSNIILL